MFDPNAYDVEPRRKFNATNAAQFLITLLLLIATGKLIYDGPECQYWSFWNRVLFYGSLIWMVYFVVTLVIQFRNEGMRLFLGVVDYIWVLFLAVLWVWNYLLRGNASANTASCALRWTHFTQVFWVLGWTVFVCILCVVALAILRIVNGKTGGRNRFLYCADQDLFKNLNHYTVDTPLNSTVLTDTVTTMFLTRVLSKYVIKGLFKKAGKLRPHSAAEEASPELGRVQTGGKHTDNREEADKNTRLTSTQLTMIPQILNSLSLLQ